ncbi:3'-5' exonuclease [Clostridium tepidum]|jgi:DNA polymerase III epsilon subunit-like protein|uniref:DNA polymerase III subunit epsilon n=1 Tax=Clostridium tepidum TaxID=1962263 RepID=A0A1S9I1B8_9CLOT|nr:3'-5' exonuclease [Clostridium tepidum]MCR1933149.1 3'-5' exonuclease [Clostridium tepidum]MDU6877312.1 3'-5' exonuclease [Clostridium botulinum]OOO62793.1 DNA polymerase III subunit epsilon [Clostridium tepidum]OOO64080.1 DNA polymerase III subunit epsilon [Clostridium tepidum]
MKKIFIDTETTDLEPGEIIQLTYCVCDINSKGEDKVSFAKNFFFNVDYIEESAKAIHGFSVERLKVLSKGKKFKDLALEISSDLNDGIFIAHNVNFDKKFVTAEFNRLNNINWYPKDFFCTMEYFKPIVKATTKTGKLKKPRLEETIDFFNIDKKVVLNGAKKLFGCDDVGFHDARYDVAALVSCYYRAKKLGYSPSL